MSSKALEAEVLTTNYAAGNDGIRVSAPKITTMKIQGLVILTILLVSPSRAQTSPATSPVVPQQSTSPVTTQSAELAEAAESCLWLTNHEDTGERARQGGSSKNDLWRPVCHPRFGRGDFENQI